MKGEEAKAIAMKDPKRLFGTANQRFFKDIMQNHKDEPGEQPVDYLYKTLSETVSSADYIFEKKIFKQNKVYLCLILFLFNFLYSFFF